jgi:fatty acid desaturase
MPETGINDAARELRERLRREGCFEPAAGRALLAWAAHLLLAFGGLYAFVSGTVPALRVVALLASCFGCLGAATIGHTASHGALSKHRLVNQLVTFASYPLLLMLSATYWHRSHVQVHHPSPNTVDVDDDCDLRPVFALNERHATDDAVPPHVRSVATFLLPLLMPLNGFSMHRQGWAHVVSELRKPAPSRQQHAGLDALLMALHLVLWLGVPMLWFSPAKVLGLYALRVGIMGFGLFAILAPGHFPEEAQCLDASLRGKNFYVRQTMATLNFRTSWLGHFLCSGLEFQIEHHLFPSVSHVHLRRMSPLVRAFCEEHGLPHRTLGWAEAVWKSYLVFLRPKPVQLTLPTPRSLGGPRGAFHGARRAAKAKAPANDDAGEACSRPEGPLHSSMPPA